MTCELCRKVWKVVTGSRNFPLSFSEESWQSNQVFYRSLAIVHFIRSDEHTKKFRISYQCLFSAGFLVHDDYRSRENSENLFRCFYVYLFGKVGIP